MNTQPNIAQNIPQDLNPNEKQQIASNPAQSVWVDASAGTGKTKILTDRVLRLLLSEQDRPASPPERIVCITFTKAAASEMSLRITKELSKWSICADTELEIALTSLMGHTPNAKQITEARTLFARVIDVPGGLKIMTIHAFCQSILQKFPLEAGLSPNFTVLTPTEAKEAIQAARLRVLGHAKREPNSQLGKAVRHLSVRSGDSQLMTFLENGLQEKQQILNVFERIPSIDDLKPALLDNCKLPKDINEASLLENFIKNTPTQDIEGMIAGFPHGANSDKKRVPELQAFLKTPSTQIDNYCNIFLTQKNTIRKAATQGTLKHAPEIEFTFPTEAERCLDMIEEQAKFYMVEDTHDFLCVSHTILDAYAKEKKNRNGLDFDDLISITHKLLKNSESAAQWVLFKLDQGIDHLLVDEAQDTNPEQWSVVEALSEEFFHGNSARDSIERTIFVVGDEKQSIYSFQKADPEIFRKMQGMFKDKVKRASKQWEDVPLSLSFRSTDAVLTLVDTVFAQDDMRQSLTAQSTQVNHSAFREGMAGHVELWPMIFGEEKEELEPWPIPRTPTTQSSAADLMAQKIAGTIKHWIDTNKTLESEDRPINAGDIMILLKKRSVFQKTLVRALKTHNIPVGGLDRMILQEHIAVKDVLAALEFGLLPQDDLTLAILLKSPLINWSEDQLMNFILTHKGKNTLWSAIREHGNNIEQGLYDYLLNINSLTLKKRPFDVISFILNHPCPADRDGSGLRAFIKRLGQDSIDPLQELLNTALDIESEKGVSVQAFVQTLKKNEKDIKREMEDGAGAVRIMTVHGSKGLQSPIVFLPDTIRTTQSRDNALQAGSKLLWPRRSGLDYPFWAPREMPDMFKDSKADALARDDREYQRLLYVALTRAKDQLYISGYANTEKSKFLEDSWYCKIETAMKAALENGVRTPCEITKRDNVTIISNAQTVPAKISDTSIQKQIQEALPTWATQPPKPEPHPARPLQPSRPSGESVSLSPLASSTDHRFKRGNIIHTLLEFLPDLSEQNRQSAAQNYVSQPGHDLSMDAQSNITQETLKILNDVNFAPVFGEGSRAEVSISGKLNNNTIINGQIDRLVITDKEIFIVDYKTNRPPPTDVKDVPAQYRKQLQAYRDVLKTIYPNHTIRTALLWTNLPLLMELQV